jgi:hypothetical protein
VAKHAAVLYCKSGSKPKTRGLQKLLASLRECREVIPPAVLERGRRDYPSRRDARIVADDLGEFYAVRLIYINRLELEGWDDNGQEVPLSLWDVQRVLRSTERCLRWS